MKILQIYRALLEVRIFFMYECLIHFLKLFYYEKIQLKSIQTTNNTNYRVCCCVERFKSWSLLSSSQVYIVVAEYEQ